MPPHLTGLEAETLTAVHKSSRADGKDHLATQLTQTSLTMLEQVLDLTKPSGRPQWQNSKLPGLEKSAISKEFYSYLVFL